MIHLVKVTKEWFVEVKPGIGIEIRFGKIGRANGRTVVPLTKCLRQDPELEARKRMEEKLKEGYTHAPDSDPMSSSAPPIPDGPQSEVFLSVPDSSRLQIIAEIAPLAAVFGLRVVKDSVVDPADSEEVLSLRKVSAAGFSKNLSSPMASLLAAIAWRWSLDLRHEADGHPISARSLLDQVDDDKRQQLQELGYAPAPLKINTARPGAATRVEVW